MSRIATRAVSHGPCPSQRSLLPGGKEKIRRSIANLLVRRFRSPHHFCRQLITWTSEPKPHQSGRPKKNSQRNTMPRFTSLTDLRALCLDLPGGHPAASAGVAAREDRLTKPPKSLGRLEDLTAFLAHWQGHAPPRLDRAEILVFAGNHGVNVQGVSAYPAEVTVQMVANFSGGGAAINQLARIAGAQLRVIPLSLETPTADFTQQPALTESEFIAAVKTGYEAVSPQSDLICLGEMGIGNTT